MAMTEAGLKAKFESVFDTVLISQIEGIDEDTRDLIRNNLDKFTTVLAKSIVEYVTTNAAVSISSISLNGVPQPGYTGTGTIS